MIQPGLHNIVIQQNADWEKTFQLFDGQGDPVNLLGSTVEAEIWTEGKRAKLADFTVTMIDEAIGKFKLGLTDQVTSTLPTSGYYDIRVTDIYGFSNSWVRGQAIVDTGYTE